MYEVGGQLLEGIRSFYENTNASVRVNGELSESFNTEVGVRQGCMMSAWLFNIYMDGWIREMKVGVWDLGARLHVRGVEQPLVAGLYVDDTVLLAETEGMLQRIVNEFERVCKRRKLKVNAGKSKVMVFERAREQTINCAKPYRVGADAILGCKIWLGKVMEEVNEFKYLGTILCKHGSMEGEVRERTVKGRQVMGALERVMQGRNVIIEVNWGIRNSVTLPTLSCASETWTWKAAEQSQIRAVEMSYMRGACGVSGPVVLIKVMIPLRSSQPRKVAASSSHQSHNAYDSHERDIK